VSQRIIRLTIMMIAGRIAITGRRVEEMRREGMTSAAPEGVAKLEVGSHAI
jgi:hypothetical protein